MTDLPLHVVNETAKTITLGWTPPPNVEWYTFYIDGRRVSNAPPADKNGVPKDKVTFGKPGVFSVVAAGPDHIGTWPPEQPNVPPPPPLNNPVTFTCKSGVPNFFDAAGRDAIIKSSGVIEQGPRNDNAIVTVKNSPTVIVEPLTVQADHLQGPGVGNGYGYGLYVIGCGTVYAADYNVQGTAVAQALVIAGGTKKVQVVGGDWTVMHPVWHLANGKPAEVHTDAVQSYGGPGILEMYDTKVVTCGSITQVQPYKGAVAPMGLWKFHRPDFAQTRNPDSDEMPQAMTKDPSGGPKWPTEFIDCTLRPLGLPFSVSWVADRQAWEPGGTWNNLGEPWTVL